MAIEKELLDRLLAGRDPNEVFAKDGLLDDHARAGITDAIGYLRGRPEKHEQHELPALPVSKSPGDGNGLDGIAKIAAAIEDERRRKGHENS